jgi:argininosuccinate lyase
MTKAVEGMSVKAQRMLQGASDPQMLATDLAEYLAARGVPFREAHGAIARLMKHCSEKGLSPVHMSLQEFRQYSTTFEQDVYSILSPKASVEGKRSPGGTAPELVEKRAAQLLREKDEK